MTTRTSDAPLRPSPGDLFTDEVAPHLSMLYRTALRMTQQDQAAEDLLQDTLERAFQSFGRYEAGTNIRAWLLRIMSNVRISGFRRVSRRPQTSSLDTMEEFSLYDVAGSDGIQAPDVESSVLNRIGEETILMAIDRLHEDFRMVVVLGDVEGFSYKEMASILEVPIGTVTSRLYRARQQLQRSLWEYARESGILTAARGSRPV